ncbi:YdeI family protein [Emticicia sp. BO119]|uniref:YdeI/OmpD-associated family protein n=1 Tax=Emticicia sp. BO119 TaxID=2757768 RepID=UPI0015EFE66D|nr:YdeI/OmpD-associated family protein [Emticicia sp. BO119]MBA4851903.1 YdeI/OmpD-associated family protein [Emticicia sp. BO119]
MAGNDYTNALTFENRQAWREWLMENHDKEKNVWIKIYKKQSQIPSVSYDEAVDEALCFAWVDSSIKSGNEEYYYQFFARRNPKSNWSRVNKAKVEKLIETGLMTEAGLKIIDFAKENGYWTALDDVENLINPADLQTALDNNRTAKTYFDAFPRSVKRSILEWLLNARQEETRKKRIIEIVTLAEKNIRANQYTPKEK